MMVKWPIYAAFTDPSATDLSILGRDILNWFDLILGRQRKEVLLLATNGFAQRFTNSHEPFCRMGFCTKVRPGHILANTSIRSGAGAGIAATGNGSSFQRIGMIPSSYCDWMRHQML